MIESCLKRPLDVKDVFGAFLVENIEFSKGKYDMPIVKSNIDELPTSLCSYQRVGKKRLSILPGTALHFYVYDYLFDGKYGIWNALVYGEEYKKGFNLNKLEGFDCIISPDYSLNLDMPIELQIYNTYRGRVVVHALQDLGYKVIVNVRWTDEASYEFCFEGIEIGSVVAIGSYGCSKSRVDRQLFELGLNELINRIRPETIIIYGTVIESVKRILENYNQKYIAFRSDMSVAMEKLHHGNEI